MTKIRTEQPNQTSLSAEALASVCGGAGPLSNEEAIKILVKAIKDLSPAEQEKQRRLDEARRRADTSPFGFARRLSQL